MLRRNIAKLALVLGGTTAGLFTMEFVLRSCVEQETKRLAVYDRDLGWRGRPHGRGVYVRHKDGIRVPFAYNNYGFRDEDVVTKTPEMLRITMLGDSFLESLEVEYGRIFHELVEQRLQGRIGKNADVVAVASQGYSPAQELLAFRKYKKQLQPDIVLSIFYSGNDFDDNLRRKFAYLDNAGELQFPENQDTWLRGQYLSLKRSLYERSHLVFLVKNFMESHAHIKLAAAGKEESPQGDDYKRDIATKILVATKAEVEANAAEFAVVIIPSRDEIQDQEFAWVATIVKACDAHRIPCRDLSQHLTTEHYFPIDIHLNTVGHAIVADRIMDLLTEAFDLTASQNEKLAKRPNHAAP